MRKLILVLALIGASAFFFAAPTTASAVVGANCSSAAVSNTWYNGNWGWWAYLHGCTAVNAVEFANVSTGRVYMVDVTRSGAVHFSFGGGGYIYGVYTDYQATYGNFVWGSGCGAPPFQIYKVFGFRLRNSNNNSWGPFHQQYQAPAEWIC